MARIGHESILGSFDRATNALLAKGPRVSRDEAEQVAKTLERQGDGTAAFVARSVYGQADSLDRAAHAHTTAEDFAAAREVLERQLRDVDSGPAGRANGLSRAELAELPARLQPAVNAMIELARVESLPAKGGRQSIRTFEAGIDHTVGLMRGAAGNARLSEEEGYGLADQLLAAGRGTEALAVRNMFTIAKAIDGKGEIVGPVDLEVVAAYARKQIDKRDDARPGFSKAEINEMPPTWRALFRVGQMVENGIV